jgi:hypothetical protein
MMSAHRSLKPSITGPMRTWCFSVFYLVNKGNRREEGSLTFSFMYFLISGASASLISMRLIWRASTTACTRGTSAPGVAVRARTRKWG